MYTEKHFFQKNASLYIVHIHVKQSHLKSALTHCIASFRVSHLFNDLDSHFHRGTEFTCSCSKHINRKSFIIMPLTLSFSQGKDKHGLLTIACFTFDRRISFLNQNYCSIKFLKMLLCHENLICMTLKLSFIKRSHSRIMLPFSSERRTGILPFA